MWPEHGDASWRSLVWTVSGKMSQVSPTREKEDATQLRPQTAQGKDFPIEVGTFKPCSGKGLLCGFQRKRAQEEAYWRDR